jgi:hypothetical protein
MVAEMLTHRYMIRPSFDAPVPNVCQMGRAEWLTTEFFHLRVSWAKEIEAEIDAVYFAIRGAQERELHCSRSKGGVGSTETFTGGMAYILSIARV